MNQKILLFLKLDIFPEIIVVERGKLRKTLLKERAKGYRTMNEKGCVIKNGEKEKNFKPETRW